MDMHSDVVQIPPPNHRLPFIFEKQFKKTRNGTLQHKNSKIQGSKMGNSCLHIKKDNVGQSSGTKLSSKASPSKKKSVASQSFVRDLSISSGVDSSKSPQLMKSSDIKVKSALFGSKSSSSSFHSNFNGQDRSMYPPRFRSSHNTDATLEHVLGDNAMKLPRGGKMPYMGQFKSAKKGAGSSSSFHSNFNGHKGSLHPLTIKSGNPLLKSSHNVDATPEHVLRESSVLKSARAERNGAAVDTAGLTITDEPENETMRKLRSFKQFDLVTDISDHYFSKNKSSMKEQNPSWARKIQKEWKILEKHLPDTIFMRVYESRMDLLRAVIIGAEGTPYHDGLFFFDVYFPPRYPNEPPQVHYHSGGLRLNPNLYKTGYVCLSLLNTWSGNKNQKWTPGVSTMLQVLVSIQGLILNAKPYFNEPGYEITSGTIDGEKKALRYNEDKFILSLKTMMYMIRSPPKNFEDLVVGHFYSRAYDILGSCKAYMEGFQVGCFLKGGVQNVNEGKGNCSTKFKTALAEYVNILLIEFERIGVRFIDEGKGNCLSKFKAEFERIGVQNVVEGKGNRSRKFKGGFTLNFWLFVGILVILLVFSLYLDI